MKDCIDAVVLWVDGSDPSWREERSKQWKLYHNQCPESNAEHRFANCDELIYCLRSLFFNTPWIRYIHLVTCGQKPKWLDVRHPKIKLVHHKQIMEAENLPTFNSCSIEMHLHKIPDLSECFLYLNDDCFVTRKTSKKHFFNPRKKAYFFSHRLMQNQPNCNELNSFNWTIRNNQECLDRLFGVKIRYRPDHQAYIIYKKAIEYVQQHAPEYFHSTQRQKFRIDSSKGEKTLNAYIFPAAGMELGMYELRLNGNEQYYTIEQAKQNYHHILNNTPILLCINNANNEGDKLFINQLMCALLPDPAPWELEEKMPDMVRKVNNAKKRARMVPDFFQVAPSLTYKYRNPQTIRNNSISVVDANESKTKRQKTEVNRRHVLPVPELLPLSMGARREVPKGEPPPPALLLVAHTLLGRSDLGRSDLRKALHPPVEMHQKGKGNRKGKGTDKGKGKGKSDPLEKVFYAPPNYVSTVINKFRSNPTVINKNRIHLYEGLSKYKPTRHPSSILP